MTTGAVIGMFKVAGIGDERPDSYAIPTAWENVLALLPPNPYQGLAAFTPTDADLFLGRDAETTLLVDAVERSPLVLVVGPSGVGKSSLVQAGLIAALPQAGWTSEVCRPGEHPDDPFRALAAAMCHAEGAAADIERQRARASEIRTSGLATLAADLRLASRRRTFYHRLLAHPDAARRLVGREVKLSPLGPAALREVIETPANRRGVRYAPRLVERIVADASTSEGALPLLEFALTELWHHQISPCDAPGSWNRR